MARIAAAYETEPTFLQCLAVIVGLFGAVWVLMGTLLLVEIAMGRFPRYQFSVGRGPLVVMASLFAVMSVVGYLFARQAWKHLRRPSRTTANAIAAIASFYLGSEIQYLAVRWHFLPDTQALGRSLFEWGLLIVLIATCYHLYRRILKPIAARAFPAEAAISRPRSAT